MQDRESGVLAMSPLQMWAAQMHEVYTALIMAGFTDTEALIILNGMLTQPDD